MDPVVNINVDHPQASEYQISWGPDFTTRPVTIGVGTSPHEFTEINTAATSPAQITLSDMDSRCYFRLTPADGDALVVAERRVDLAGGVNFRDIGGYATDDGRRVRWGRLFRSGHMSGLSAADLARFAGLGVSRVCDFRLDIERASENADLPGAPVVHVLGIEPGIGDREFFHRLFAQTDDPEDVRDAMHRMMAVLVRDAAPNYAPLFEVLLDDPPGAILMNCSAGKERTGVASALLLSALGVPRATIMYDFMLSARYFPAAAEVPRVLKKYQVTRANGEALIMPLLETRRSYLDAAFAAIEEDYGTPQAFLEAHYGVDAKARARLRDLYTD